jgi:hypothetical protein
VQARDNTQNPIQFPRISLVLLGLPRIRPVYLTSRLLDLVDGSIQSVARHPYASYGLLALVSQTLDPVFILQTHLLPSQFSWISTSLGSPRAWIVFATLALDFRGLVERDKREVKMLIILMALQI